MCVCFVLGFRPYRQTAYSHLLLNTRRLGWGILILSPIAYVHSVREQTCENKSIIQTPYTCSVLHSGAVCVILIRKPIRGWSQIPCTLSRISSTNSPLCWRGCRDLCTYIHMRLSCEHIQELWRWGCALSQARH